VYSAAPVSSEFPTKTPQRNIKCAVGGSDSGGGSACVLVLNVVLKFRSTTPVPLAEVDGI
jgi:hypothetical protein